MAFKTKVELWSPGFNHRQSSFVDYQRGISQQRDYFSGTFGARAYSGDTLVTVRQTSNRALRMLGGVSRSLLAAFPNIRDRYYPREVAVELQVNDRRPGRNNFTHVVMSGESHSQLPTKGNIEIGTDAVKMQTQAGIVNIIARRPPNLNDIQYWKNPNYRYPVNLVLVDE